MYGCKQCGTGNPLDSSFCKKCGSALPADELAEARSKLAEMLDEGNSLFTEGRTDEAMLIAEAAVTANPSSHLAYSLKGLCHERMGDIAEALECYETAVGLNADSSLDKVKVAALRNRLAQRVSDAPEPNRRNAAMLGVAAAVLFLVGGSLAAIGMSNKKDSGKVALNTTPTPPLSSDLGVQAPLSGGNLTNPTTPNPSATNTQPPPIQPPATGGAQQLEPDLPPVSGRLPAPDGDEGSIPPAPVRISGIPVPDHSEGPIPSGGTHASDRGGDPPPTPLETDKVPDRPATPSKPADDASGYISIQMAPRAQSTPGGGAVVQDGNGMRAVLEAAQVDYQTGKYDSAAGKYSQVAGMGGNSPRIQQRLGDCYRNLGNSAKAKSAYNRAITMYQAEIKQGVDVGRSQAGLDTCESALKVLGG